MDEARLWALIEDQAERLPLLTLGEARAAVQLLGEQRGELADVAAELAGSLRARFPAE